MKEKLSAKRPNSKILEIQKVSNNRINVIEILSRSLELLDDRCPCSYLKYKGKYIQTNKNTNRQT